MNTNTTVPAGTPGKDRPLRAGLIGLGMMGRNHARNLQALEGVDLVAVADPQGDPHGAAPGYDILPDAEALLEAGIDYAVVAVPTQFHRDVALTFAQAGVHCLVEKPLAFDIDEAEEITAAFEQAGLTGAVGYIERYNPALQEMRRRLAAGQLGEIYQIVTRRQGAFPARIADVGVVKDLGTHDLDLTAWVADSTYAEVAATSTRRSGRQDEDMVSIAGRLSSGAITNHLVNWLSPFKERVTVVTGEKGALVADTLTADLTFHANADATTNFWDQLASFRGVSEGDTVRYALQRQEPLKNEHEAFRDALLGSGGNIVTMREGLNTVRTVEAVLTAASEDRVVHLDGAVGGA
jgi:UDP-N-acetylglucosamine 3-dehydrogenase